MNRLAKLLKELEYEDLQLVQKDLEEGNIKKIIKKQLKEKRDEKIVSCPVCEEPIKQGEGWYMEFGSSGLRQKANFDGLDCLKYFIEERFKKNKKEEIDINNDMLKEPYDQEETNIGIVKK